MKVNRHIAVYSIQPTVAKLLSTIKTAKVKNNIFCEVPHAALSQNILKVFRKYNLIYGAQVGNTTIRAFLRYFRGKPTLSVLTSGTRPSRPLYINKKKLARLLKHNPTLVFVFSTPNGIVGLNGPIRLNPLTTHNVGELLCFGW